MPESCSRMFFRCHSFDGCWASSALLFKYITLTIVSRVYSLAVERMNAEDDENINRL